MVRRVSQCPSDGAISSRDVLDYQVPLLAIVFPQALGLHLPLLPPTFVEEEGGLQVTWKVLDMYLYVQVVTSYSYCSHLWLHPILCFLK